MLNPWSVVMLVLGLLVGYFVPDTPVVAQSSGYPVTIGERANFIGEDGRIMGSCVIAQIQGDYIGCRREGLGRDEVTDWWRMDRVVHIQKLRNR